MGYRNLQHFIEVLDREGELVRIKEAVSPRLEISEITDRISKSPGGGKALLFENTGYDFPLLINAFGSYRRICLALGVKNLDEVASRIEELLKSLARPREGLLEKLALLPQLNRFASWMPRSVSGKGECQEVVQGIPDLLRLPVMKCWPLDGGPFITLPVIHTRDPQTGIRNVGMYRMQVFSGNLTGMHWHKHKVSARHFNAYKQLGKRMPVAVILGGDPVYTYAATAPLPENVDEYMLAGFLRKKRVDLVPCLTQDIEVPADADFVIEGFVDPNEDLIWEGPFGDHTGYYSLADWYPRFHVTCITHKRQAVYPTTIVGIPPQEDAWIGKATERIFLAPIKMTLIPEILDMEMPVEGVFHNLVIVKIRKDYAGQAQKVMNAMWGAGQMMFNKILIIVGQEADPKDYYSLARLVSQNLVPMRDIYFSQGPMDVLDHSCSALGFGGKMCLDGTIPFEEESKGFELFHTLDFANLSHLSNQFPEIKDINFSLPAKGIPVLLLSVEKNRKGHIRELNRQLFALPELNAIRMLLYAEHTVDIHDLASSLWRILNNLDPNRDHYFDGHGIGLDGTRKTQEWDDFQRDWPNIIISDDETIRLVDAKWNKLGLGPLLSSPSLRLRSQIYGNQAKVS